MPLLTPLLFALVIAPALETALGGLGNALSRTASTTVSLDAPLTGGLLLLGLVLALGGGLIAGTAGALRAARLRPADALRQVE